MHSFLWVPSANGGPDRSTRGRARRRKPFFDERCGTRAYVSRVPSVAPPRSTSGGPKPGAPRRRARGERPRTAHDRAWQTPTLPQRREFERRSRLVERRTRNDAYRFRVRALRGMTHCAPRLRSLWSIRPRYASRWAVVDARRPHFAHPTSSLMGLQQSPVVPGAPVLRIAQRPL
jgi:hypothetical protein